MQTIVVRSNKKINDHAYTVESEPNRRKRAPRECVFDLDAFFERIHARIHGDIRRREKKTGYATLFSRGARRVCAGIVTKEGGEGRNGITFSGGSFPHSKLLGCHSNWPGAEQSGLLPAICQRLSRYLFSPPPSFPFFSSSPPPPPCNRHLPLCATRVQGVVFRFKRPRIHL